MWTTAYKTIPKEGEHDNGDAVLVRSEGDRMLLAVIDGLGHGRHAAHASGMAIDYLARWSLDEELDVAMKGIHEALRGSRGAAAGVCLLRASEFVCCGVGNVEIRCLGARLPILLSPGVLGARVQSFRICRGELPPDCRVVLFSDGISHRAPLESLRQLDPDALCDTLMREHRKPGDDASVVICDYKARGHD